MPDGLRAEKLLAFIIFILCWGHAVRTAAQKPKLAARRVPLRREVLLSDTWDLTPLYPSDEAWERDFKQLQADYGKISDFRGRVGESPSTLRDALEFEKSVDIRVERLSQYASLRVAEDASNDASLSREARLDSLRVRIGEAFSFLFLRSRRLPTRPSTVISLTRRLSSGWFLSRSFAGSSLTH